MPKTRSAFTCWLPVSSTRSADGWKPSQALASIMMTMLGVLFAVATLLARQRRIQLNDLAKVVTVSDPQISPYGKSIVCVVSRPNFAEDRYDNELVLVDVATGNLR